MPSLQTLCRVVRAMVALAAAVLVTLPFWLWAMPGWVHAMALHAASLPAENAPRHAASTAWAAAATLLPAAVGLAVCWQLWHLFGAFTRGQALTPPALLRLRRFAGWLLALALVQPIYRAAMSVALSLGNPPGSRQLVIGLSSNDYLNVLLALVFVVIAHVMGEAVRAAEENRGFV
jgi:hypothetical protein